MGLKKQSRKAVRKQERRIEKRARWLALIAAPLYEELSRTQNSEVAMRNSLNAAM